MSEPVKCPKCGALLVTEGGRTFCPHEEVTSLRRQLAEAREEGERALDERDIVKNDLRYVTKERDTEKARAERAERRCECLFPTEADLDWMMNAFQRHTSAVGDHSDVDTIPSSPDRIPDSIQQWWKENVVNEAINARMTIQIIISTWEAGRAKGRRVKEAGA